MVYGTYNELVTGAYKPTYNWGASHCSILPGLVSIQKTMERSTIINGYISSISMGHFPVRYVRYTTNQICTVSGIPVYSGGFLKFIPCFLHDTFMECGEPNLGPWDNKMLKL